jgi:hypothetical protein
MDKIGIQIIHALVVAAGIALCLAILHKPVNRKHFKDAYNSKYGMRFYMIENNNKQCVMAIDIDIDHKAHIPQIPGGVYRCITSKFEDKSVKMNLEILVSPIFILQVPPVQSSPAQSVLVYMMLAFTV